MKPVVLIVMDGWGVSDREDGNAVKNASTPNLDRLSIEYPFAKIDASGLSVGLPDGQMGNSEVGHLTLGAGRIIYQDLTKISKAVEDGTFGDNTVLLKAIKETKSSGNALHLMGLLSDGGVHSHNTHLYAILKSCKEQGLEKVFIHAFLDGRDTPPKSGKGYMEELVSMIKEVGVGKVATISGRYYAMDRDKRWDRVEKAYLAITSHKGESADDAVNAIADSYENDLTDEFMLPTVVKGSEKINDGDTLLFFNFRADRAREISYAFIDGDFNGFTRKDRPKLSGFYTMTEYEEGMKSEVLFPNESLKNILADVLADREIKQFRVSETEKYAHITFFFNGGVDTPYLNEDRKLIDSDKDIKTYDERPAMKASDIADSAIEKIEEGGYGFVLMNFANGDMVGHTGIYDAAIKGCEAVDEAVGRVTEAGLKNGYTVLITADHGNAEQMVNYDTNEPLTSHTSNLVPLIFVDDNMKGEVLHSGGLSDIAPTVLKIMGIEKPREMTGKALI